MSEKARFKRLRTSGRIWDSRKNGPYIRKKHGPLAGKDKENYDKAVEQIIEDIEAGKTSDRKY